MKHGHFEIIFQILAVFYMAFLGFRNDDLKLKRILGPANRKRLDDSKGIAKELKKDLDDDGVQGSLSAKVIVRFCSKILKDYQKHYYNSFLKYEVHSECIILLGALYNFLLLLFFVYVGAYQDGGIDLNSYAWLFSLNVLYFLFFCVITISMWVGLKQGREVPYMRWRYIVVVFAALSIASVGLVDAKELSKMLKTGLIDDLLSKAMMLETLALAMLPNCLFIFFFLRRRTRLKRFVNIIYHLVDDVNQAKGNTGGMSSLSILNEAKKHKFYSPSHSVLMYLMLLLAIPLFPALIEFEFYTPYSVGVLFVLIIGVVLYMDSLRWAKRSDPNWLYIEDYFNENYIKIVKSELRKS